MHKIEDLNGILFDLSLAVGGRLDLFELLRTSLKEYTRKLGCVDAIVFRVTAGEKDQYNADIIFSIPYTLFAKETPEIPSDLVMKKFIGREYEDFCSTLPKVRRIAPDYSVHLMELECFGFLALVKEGEPFDENIIIGLSRINQKLAESCMSCLKYEALERSELLRLNQREYLPEMICELDKQGGVNYLNTYASERLGYTFADIGNGLKVNELIAQEDIGKFTRNLHSSADNEARVQDNYNIVSKDAEIFPALVYITPKIDNDSIVGFILLIIDISDIKAKENRLERYAERLELALLGSNAGLWDWNVSTGEVYYSEKWCNMLGFEQDEIAQNLSTWERLVHPDDMPYIVETLNLHLEGKTPLYQTEHRVRTKSGEYKWILDTGKVTRRDASGAPLRAVGTHIDITENKKLEALDKIERDISILLARAESLETTLEICLDVALVNSGMEAGGIYIEAEQKGSYRLVKHRGLSEDFVQKASFYGPESPNSELISSGKPVYSLHGDLVPDSPTSQIEKLKALAVLPIMHMNRVIGCFNIGSRTMETVPDFTREVLERISMHIGSFIVEAKNEEKIRQIQQDVNTAFNTIDDFLFILDMEGRIIYFNSTVTSRLGYSENELTGESVLRVHPPEKHEEAALKVQGMLMGTETVCRVPLLTKSGNFIPVETRVKLEKWAGRDAVIAISKDTSQLKEYKKSLQENSERLGKDIRG
ncbi:MAG: PAS domain S-box protein [Bacteroidales bacterium]